MYQEYFESIISFFNERFPEELQLARKDFFLQTGEIFEDDAFYEDRVTNYLEWFLFDRPFRENPSAIDYYRQTLGSEPSEMDMETLKAFSQPIHGMFEVRRIKPKLNQVVLRDLCDQSQYTVTERRTLVALTKGSLFEARLFAKNDKIHFMQAFVHHPAQASKFIRKTFKLLRKEVTEDFRPVFLKLQKCWMDSQRYGHVDPKRIYNDEHLQNNHHDSLAP